MTLNESIRALRRERSMTQEQLAEAMNVSAAAVSKWENGQSVPDIAVLTALADYFEVSLDALVGYTVQSRRREDMVVQIRTLSRQKRYPQAVEMAEEALRRYPNHFRVVYESARMYGCYGSEHHQPDMLRRAIALMERAMSLLDQNSDPALRAETLWSYMGGYYANLEEREHAIRCYQAGNIAGLNNVAIANSRVALGQYDAALPALTQGLISSLLHLYNAGSGAIRCLLAKGDTAEAEAMNLWLMHTLEGMAATPGSYINKLQTMVHGRQALIRLAQGDEAGCRSQLTEALMYARRFDALPDYRLRSIRFYRPDAGDHGEERALYDSMGETAMEALRRITSQNDAAHALLTALCVAGPHESPAP